jgi:hypothetical protein
MDHSKPVTIQISDLTLAQITSAVSCLSRHMDRAEIDDRDMPGLLAAQGILGQAMEGYISAAEDHDLGKANKP